MLLPVMSGPSVHIQNILMLHSMLHRSFWEQSMTLCRSFGVPACSAINSVCHYFCDGPWRATEVALSFHSSPPVRRSMKKQIERSANMITSTWRRSTRSGLPRIHSSFGRTSLGSFPPKKSSRTTGATSLEFRQAMCGCFRSGGQRREHPEESLLGQEHQGPDALTVRTWFVLGLGDCHVFVPQERGAEHSRLASET